MQGFVIRVENQSVVEKGWILGDALFHFGIPKLNSTTPFGLPCRVQIKNQVYAPVPSLVVVVHTEIGVDVQEAAARGLVKAAAFHAVVGHESRNPGQF